MANVTAGKIDDEIAQLHVAYAMTGDRRLRDALLAHYDPFAVRLARAFPSWREDRADLVQVARIGLIHAVDRFDPSRQRPFFAFARPTIVGELKRHIRDHSWRLRVPRSLQEQYLVVMRTGDDLAQELRRLPLIGEVAARTGFTDGQVLEAMELANSMTPVSVDQSALGDEPEPLSAEDPALRGVENAQTVAKALALLPERDRQAVRLRFEQELTQSQIAVRVGVTQMSISRALARSLGRMRSRPEPNA